MKISKNITSIFIVPSLEIPRQDRIDNGFINDAFQDFLMSHKDEITKWIDAYKIKSAKVMQDNELSILDKFNNN